MDRNPLKCCIPPCFQTKSRCPCHLPKFRNRVNPANEKPVVFTVSKTMSPTPNASNHLHLHTKFNGQTNLFFHEDEVTGISGLDEGRKLHLLNGTAICDDVDDTPIEIDDDTSDREEADNKCSLDQSQGFFEFLSTVYVQLSKSKQLRVIHINSRVLDGSQPVSAKVQMRTASSSDDDEEDYWFSKWSRRPKLKNTVKCQANSSKSRREVLLEINSRTTLSYEQIEDEEERSPERFCPGSFELSRPNGESPPCSPTGINVTPKYTDEVDSSNPIVTSIENFQPDLEPSDAEVLEELSPTTAFTNFGFQFDPDDSAHTDDEKLKTEPTPNVTPSEDLLEVTSTVIDENLVLSKVDTPHVKVNGWTKGINSPHSNPHKTVPVLRNGHTTPVSEGSPEPFDKIVEHSKPLLFFIHGISGSSDIWKSQFKYFHDLGYEIVAPDLLGHGMSSTPDKAKHYLFETMVQDLVAIFDHFVNGTRTSVVIGHGYGACMGTVLSRIRSQNVTLLISVSGGGPTPLIPCGFSGIGRPFIPMRFRFRKKKSRGRFDNPDLAHVLPESIRQHVLNGQLWVDGDAAFHRRVTVPTLLVYGMRDTVVSLIEECEMERTIPKAFLELLPTAGHMAMCDDSSNFNRMLVTFIEAWADTQT